MQSWCRSVYRNSLVFLSSSTLKLAFVISYSIRLLQIFIYNDDSKARRGGNPTIINPNNINIIDRQQQQPYRDSHRHGNF